MDSTLFDHKINGMTPFLSHRDCVYDRLSEAHALLLIFQDVYRYASSDPTADGSINTLNNDIKADAMQAIGTLVALAQFHLLEEHQSRAKPEAVAA